MFLYTAYADDPTFFLKDKKPVTELMNIFDTFSKFSGLKPNKSKYEIAGLGALKGVQVALFGMRCSDLMSNVVKILGIYYSYNEKLEIQENFKRHIINIENILRIWRMRDLSIAGKITFLNYSCNFKKSTSCISENNSKFNYTTIKQNSKRIYMENSQS